MDTYLWTGQLFVLLPLSHFNWWQVSYRRDQEVHQYVLTVGGAIHQSPQRLGQVVGEQVVVVPVGQGKVLYRCVHYCWNMKKWIGHFYKGADVQC